MTGSAEMVVARTVSHPGPLEPPALPDAGAVVAASCSDSSVERTESAASPRPLMYCLLCMSLPPQSRDPVEDVTHDPRRLWLGRWHCPGDHVLEARRRPGREHGRA